MAQAYPFQTPPIIVFSSCKLLNLNSNEQWCLVSDSIQLRGRTQKKEEDASLKECGELEKICCPR